MTTTESAPTGLRRQLRNTARLTAFTGGPLFWLGTLLHPARDGWSIAAVGERYGLTHDIQAAGLGLQVACLASMIALSKERRDLRSWYAAMAGTLFWFALIVFDGSHNPVRAEYAPSMVHEPADLNTPAALIVFPALLIFPLGYVWLGRALSRRGLTLHGVLLGVGAVAYTVGGLFIFTSGPRFGLIQIFEVAGATLYTVGYVLLGRRA
ncbi:hypothetical protein GCM10009630_51410 [Kribbella jejuensis]|uniref:DUF998 domain-containing protein n=1 Tax=Kribbella jejuensis TaxID=236068 RepID=A0A542DA40_9ACTN|nr:hypothetical protein [Kribbella jejuensis]TQI99941.1 hypothetical protein FB475_6930 [Kribbella jejuensis]